MKSKELSVDQIVSKRRSEKMLVSLNIIWESPGTFLDLGIWTEGLDKRGDQELSVHFLDRATLFPLSR